MKKTQKPQKDLAERATTWGQSQESQKSLKEALKRAIKTNVELEKARRIDPTILEKPFTV